MGGRCIDGSNRLGRADRDRDLKLTLRLRIWAPVLICLEGEIRMSVTVFCAADTTLLWEASCWGAWSLRTKNTSTSTIPHAYASSIFHIESPTSLILVGWAGCGMAPQSPYLYGLGNLGVFPGRSCHPSRSMMFWNFQVRALIIKMESVIGYRSNHKYWNKRQSSPVVVNIVETKK